MKRLVMALAPLVVASALGWWLVRPDPGPTALTGSGTTYAVTVRFAQPPNTGTITADIQVEPATADAVWLSAVMPDMGHATPEVNAEPLGAGRFRATGELFFMAGGWELTVRVSGPAGTELVTIDVAVG